MNPTPILTVNDYNLLRKLTKNAKDSTNITEINLLTKELDRAIINKDVIFDQSIVRINSQVIVEDVNTKQQFKFQIVLPLQTNFKESKFSILAPLCVAIIGFKEKDQVEWQLPSGNKTLKIITVNNSASE